VSLAAAVDRGVAGSGDGLDVGSAGGAAGHGAARSLSDLISNILILIAF
jgi:F0F1-type ATP synthase membrane subunit c/vacuolar-type H+-ATPase subunit K